MNQLDFNILQDFYRNLFGKNVSDREWNPSMKNELMDEIDHIRTIFEVELQKTYGQKVLYAKDCQILSISILQKINRRISVSTLKRLFGIVHYPYHPSKYTLDSIALYLGYRNWTDLKNSDAYSKPFSTEPDYWTLLKNRIQIVTGKSLTSMKAKLGDQLSDFQVREFAIKKFDAFLNSPQIATAFIAPGGFGKTTIVTQLTEMFFTGDHARYPDDIVCLIDGSILVNLINLNLEVVRLKNIVDFEHKKSFSVYFRKHPDQVKGRFVLIIESLYQIYHQEGKLNQFVENLMDMISAYRDISWFKLLITCRPDNWKIFSNLMQLYPHLKTKWFDVNFEGATTDCINIPSLSNNEIRHYLEKRNSPRSFEHLKFHFPDITDIINNPYMLHLFSSSQIPDDVHNDIGLLNYFVSNRILLEPYLEEKSTIINAFFQLSDYAKQTTSINKADLPTSAELNSAYKELIFKNVFYEYTVPGSYLSVKTHVKFSNDILLEFFLANKWIEENRFDLELIRLVYKFYENNPMLQINILKYLIKIAFKESNIEILKDIFSIFESNDRSTGPLVVSPESQEIINTIGVELRKNRAAREILIPVYAKSRLGQLYYFERFFDMDSLVLHSGENINQYLENKHTEEAMIYGHFIKFMHYFLAGDQINCKNEYELFQSYTLTDHIEPALAGYYYGPQLIYQSFFEGRPDRNLVKEIYRRSELFFKRGTTSKAGIPIFEYTIIYSLNYGDCYSEIIKLSNLMFTKYKAESFIYSWRSQLFLLIFARALLNSGDAGGAIRLYKQVELQNIPVNLKYYVRLRYSLIQVEFLIFEKKWEEAKFIIEEIKTISQMIRYKYFYEKALLLESAK